MHRAPDGLPLPPSDLAGYIAPRADGDTSMALAHYVGQGKAISGEIVALLGPEWSWDSKVVLDFGCGSGRVLRQFVDRGSQLHGCDIDERCIAWVQANLGSGVDARLSAPNPPLTYHDGQFDLVYATSVFAHLTDSWADWLLEMRRILKPGGQLIASVMGSGSSQAIAGEPWDPDRIAMNVLGYDRPWHAGGPMVLHSEWWLRAHWGRAFETTAFAQGAVQGQDAVVLTRPATPAPSAAELRAPEPDEPRELVAALHCITQINREYATLNASHDRYAAAYMGESRRAQSLAAENAALRAAAERSDKRSSAARRATAVLSGMARRARRHRPTS